MRFTCKIGGI